MILKDNEYRVKEMDGVKTFTITKEALEKWRDYFHEAAKGANNPLLRGNYHGRADALTDLLKHFEEEI